MSRSTSNAFDNGFDSRASGAILIIPAVEKGRGGGHLRRSALLAEAIRARGGEAWLYAGPPPDVPAALVPPELWIGAEAAAGKTWSLVALDRFRSDPEEARRWSALAPVLGIDEGRARGECDFLIDLLPGLPGRELLPGLPGKEAPNLRDPSLLPLPSRRRPSFFRDSSAPPRALISFGAEDAAGLTLAAAGAFSAWTGGGGASPLRSAPAFSLTAVLGPLYREKEQSRAVLEKSGVTVIDGERLPPGREGSPDLRDVLADYDLLVTHFGVTAFQALYARLPVLLLNPGTYHERLARAAGLPSTGTGNRAAARLWTGPALDTLARQSEKAANRWGLDDGLPGTDLGGGQSGCGLADILLKAAPRVYRACPLCGKNPGKPAARFPGRTYRRCSCGAFYMNRLNPPPVEYDRDYFFTEYRKQYGKTYLEDFPSLKKAGERRLARIRALLPRFPPPRNSFNTQDTVLKRNAPNAQDTVLKRNSPNAQDTALKRNSSNTGAGPRLLDLGCAYGPFLAAAREGGFEALGQDPAEEAAAYVRDQLGIPAFRGRFPGDAARLAAWVQENGGFDVISLWYVIEHFDEPGTALAAINGLLKIRGILAFSTPSAAGISRRKSLRTFLERSPADHWTVWDPRRCGAILRR
ncbi:MAG: class I SAM-dependent methyltransferase, partial [Treponema sp.]|nr:class I SAM-dependent methyltransferase [Treponema sp.]